ncbi:MAG: flagellar motor switch protein FliN [Phycisphaeraceae bacterium]
MAEANEQPDAQSAQDQPAGESHTSEAEQALDGAQESLNEVQRAVDENAAAEQAPGASAATRADDTTWMPEAKVRNSDGTPAGIELLGDVDLDVTIELGRTEMLVEDVLRLTSGSVVELDKLAGDPVDVYVNGRLVARGEVLVLNDNFCIRISEIVANLEEEAEAAAQEGQSRRAAG